MLASIGEILVDIFEDEGKRTAFPGGAPFNVACNAILYTKKVYFVGAVGNDGYGEMLSKVANSRPFLKNGIVIKEGLETSRAVVTLKNGERSFRFERENGADCSLSFDDIDFSLLRKGDIVHIGSLMLSFAKGVDFFKGLVERIRDIEGVKISFDVNYRDDIFPSPEVAKELSLFAMRQADILKFSADELLFLSGERKILPALKKLVSDEQLAVVTLGKEGSIFYKGKTFLKIPTVKLKPIDTTGAGDAFYAYFLASLVNDPSFIDDEEKIVSRLKRANIAGGVATLKKGGVGVAPKESEIDEYLKMHAEF